MKIMMKESNSEGEEVVKNGQLNLVDLAGYVLRNEVSFVKHELQQLLRSRSPNHTN